MGMSGPSEGGGMMSEINVTPFVDVMLVLLIIFMVTAPMMTSGVELDLPRAEAPTLTTDAEDQVVLSVNAERRYYIGDNEFPLEELESRLAEMAKAKPEQPVFVRADGKLPYEVVLQLVATAKNAGIVRVGLLTQQPEGSAP